MGAVDLMSVESRPGVVAQPAAFVLADEADVIDWLIRRGLGVKPKPSFAEYDVAARVLERLAFVSGSGCGNLGAISGSTLDAGNDLTDDARHAFITTAEAAARLGVTRSRVTQMLRDPDDALQGRKSGPKVWLVEVASIDARCSR